MGRDSEVFQLAEHGYKAVGLVQHARKRKRNQTSGIIPGADFDGMAGRVMAPRHRVAILCLVTMHIVTLGTCARKVLSVLLGCWIHVIVFRRIIFSVIDQLFREGLDKPPDQIFRLSAQALCELQSLAVLGPLAQVI